MKFNTLNLKSIFNLFPKGIHGVNHSYRVFLLIEQLCKLEKVTKAEREILEFCAFFHDIGRINDDIDIVHGYNSFKKLKKYHFFNLTSFNNPTVKFIIENHCLDDYDAISNVVNYNIIDIKRAKFLLMLFKDADGLDRFRLGDFNKKYLRNSSASKIIDFAEKINKRAYSQKDISYHIISWIKSNKK